MLPLECSMFAPTATFIHAFIFTCHTFIFIPSICACNWSNGNICLRLGCNYCLPFCRHAATHYCTYSLLHLHIHKHKHTHTHSHIHMVAHYSTLFCFYCLPLCRFILCLFYPAPRAVLLFLLAGIAQWAYLFSVFFYFSLLQFHCKRKK